MSASTTSAAVCTQSPTKETKSVEDAKERLRTEGGTERKRATNLVSDVLPLELSLRRHDRRLVDGREGRIPAFDGKIFDEKVCRQLELERTKGEVSVGDEHLSLIVEIVLVFGVGDGKAA
jgi:hypothetical protein